MTYRYILTENQGRVGIITLNRPRERNALSADLMKELASHVDALEQDSAIHVILITGDDKAFAGGADIKGMVNQTFVDSYVHDLCAGDWLCVARCRKPVIAAVSGYALGGGNELAMMCDIVMADSGARFGQPEITLGIPPGMGGTQRLVRAIGKSKAMEMCLSGRMMTAEEAERSGLISRVVEDGMLMDETLKLANRIASLSLPAVMMIKECINRAFESSLSEGLSFERRLFHAAFATQDQKEGMTAFLEKREATFQDC